MLRRLSNPILAIVSITVFALFAAACGGATPTPVVTEEAVEEVEHEAEEAENRDEEAKHEDEEEGHMHDDEELMAGEHEVPDEAAAVMNPIAASDGSIAMGAELYAANCAICHGETGQGDGPSAAGLEKPPSNLQEDHVQGLTDGALFYIISRGLPETAMPAWETTLSEEERWDVVNFLRTLAE